MVKTLLSMIFLILGIPAPRAEAKAYFQTPSEMIQKAEVIAIISVSNVQPSQAQGKTWTYRQTGEARVEAVLKGELPEKIRIYGAEDFICAQCPLANGRFLAFLKKDDKLWTGSNWGMSLCLITGENVDWFSDGDNRRERKLVSLETVLKQIRSQLAKALPVAGADGVD